MSTRRLAAIMFADIVGYTAMMQQNEDLGMAKANRFREVMETLVKAHDGDILEFRGDGGLSIFNSAIEAVRCAKEIQDILKADVPLRIGIHLGDIVLKNHHIYGDGVNLASRVESMGVPGSILVTERVIHDVKSHPEFEMTSLGKFLFKNVEKPMEVFALANEGLAVPRLEEMGGKAMCISAKTRNPLLLKLQVLVPIIVLLGMIMGYKFWTHAQITEGIPQKSIAILPFKNLSNDAGQEYFSEGISEEILFALAGINDLKVSGRSSSFSFKGKSLDLREVGELLGVQTVLEGSARKEGDRFRIDVQLVNADNGYQIWSQQYDREMADIFAIQEEIAREVVKQLKVNVSLEEKEQLKRRYMDDPTLYDLYLQASYRQQDLSPESIEEAEKIFHQIIDRDSTFALAYLHLAYNRFIQGAWVGLMHPDSAKNEGLAFLEEAFYLEPDLAKGNTTSASISFYWEQNFAKTERELQQSIEYGFTDAYFIYAELLCKTGRFDQAREQLKTFKKLDPLHPFYFVYSGIIHHLSGDSEKAIVELEYVVDANPEILDAYNKLGKVFLNTGQPHKAVDVLERGMYLIGYRPPAMLGDLAIAYYQLGNKTKKDELLAELHDKWETSGVTGSPAFFIAQVYSATDENELAFQWLETSKTHKEIELTWLMIEPQFAPLHNDARFNQLLTDAGFERSTYKLAAVRP